MPTFNECPVCGGSELRPVFAVRDHLVTGEVFNLVGCQSCETRLISPAPDETEMQLYYRSKEYISHSDTRRGLINIAYGLARPIMLWRKRRLVERLSGLGAGRLLDVGCGTGAFLNTMRGSGWEVAGMDSSETAREAVRRHTGLEAFTDDEFFKQEMKLFDVITLWHVLEHLHRLESYLNRIKELLKPGGTLFIAVPNYDSLDGDAYQSMWAAYDAPRHLYHFTPRSMARLTERFTFKITDRVRLPLDSFYVALLSERNLHGQGRYFRGLWLGLKSYLQALKRPDRSSSLIYVCQADG